MGALSWGDTDYPDLRITAPTPTPAARRLSEALIYRDGERVLGGVLYHDAVAYWQAHDRREDREPRRTISTDAGMVATYLLGRQDMAQLHSERDLADDRPSGVLALVAGMFYTAVLFGLLFGAGLVLGAIRWGF